MVTLFTYFYIYISLFSLPLAACLLIARFSPLSQVYWRAPKQKSKMYLAMASTKRKRKF